MEDITYHLKEQNKILRNSQEHLKKIREKKEKEEFVTQQILYMLVEKIELLANNLKEIEITLDRIKYKK